MRDGFIKTAACTPLIQVADCRYNAQKILEELDEAYASGAKLIVFPELCITGYTCGDLFWQDTLLEDAKEALRRITAHTKGHDGLVFVGVPWEKRGKLYNTAAVLSNGELIGLVPKHHLPNYNEFYEQRHFSEGTPETEWVTVDGKQVPFGMDLLFQAVQMEGFTVAAELCEDLWAPKPPSVDHALAGATVIVNLSASDEVTGKHDYRRALVSGQSARLLERKSVG